MRTHADPANRIQQMFSVNLSHRVWDEVSGVLWDALPDIPCEGCNGENVYIDREPCGICQGTGLSTMYHPSLDGNPIAEAARAIDTAVHGSIPRAASEELRDIL